MSINYEICLHSRRYSRTAATSNDENVIEYLNKKNDAILAPFFYHLYQLRMVKSLTTLEFMLTEKQFHARLLDTPI